MSEIELRDAILRLALQLQRMTAGDQAKADQLMRELIADLKQLLQSNALSEAGKAEINALIKDAEKSITATYAQIAKVTDTHALALVVADKTVEALEDVIPLVIGKPTPEVLASLTKDVLIDGAPSSAWWTRQAEKTAFDFAREVRVGVINGDTNERIVQRIVGSRTEPGIMDVARRNARALVHSSVMSAANDARLATYRKNAKLIAGVRFLATLDSHTCVQCSAHDGAAWDLDGKRIQGTKIYFDPPSLHWNCRCVLSPIPKSFRELGIDIPEPDETGERASSEGPVAATTTFADFLDRQSPAFIEKVLGAKRAAMFRDGKLTLSDLVSGTGRELTLDELESA